MTEFEIRYLPSNWLDEVIPEPKAHPNLFLFHTDELGWHMRDPDDEGSDFNEPGWLTTLKAGQVVNFSANRVFGDFVLTVDADGSFTTDRPIPAEANCFRIDHDTDTLCESLNSLVANGTGFGGGIEPGVYDIDAYWWSDEEYRFQFEVVDGAGVFVACGVAR